MSARGPAPSATSRERDEKRRAHETVHLGSSPGKAPTLARRERAKLHKGAREWWDVWAKSPQASMLGSTDWHTLRTRLLPLVDRFHRALDAGELDEVRRLAETLAKLEKPFGATPGDRQSLRWVFREVPLESGASSDEGGETTPRKPRRPQTDPRLALVEGGRN